MLTELVGFWTWNIVKRRNLYFKINQSANEPPYSMNQKEIEIDEKYLKNPKLMFKATQTERKKSKKKKKKKLSSQRLVLFSCLYRVLLRA